MVTLAAIAARIASKSGMRVGAVAEIDEDMRGEVNGAWPIQLAPSPPIWVKVVVSRSIHCAM